MIPIEYFTREGTWEKSNYHLVKIPDCCSTCEFAPKDYWDWKDHPMCSKFYKVIDISGICDKFSRVKTRQKWY